MQVLVDVAQEVGQLERPSQCRGVRRGLVARADRAQDRKHLQANHFRGAVHVAVERGAVGIVGDGQVHPHRGQEVVEQFAARCRSGARCAAPRRAPGRRRCVRRRRRIDRTAVAAARPGRGVLGRIEIVEDVVGVAGEAVERVHGGR